MAISRSQQPRQMYGLGSFVKKVTRKITKPITKVAQKIVPKEIAGIMRTAAPFLPPGYREAAYLLGTAKQTGRISPVDLALVLAPQVGRMKVGDSGLTVKQQLGALDVPFSDKTLGEFFVGAPADPGIDVKTVAGPIEGASTAATGTATLGASEATSGLFGKGGEMFQLGKGTLPGTGGEAAKQSFGIMDTGAGQTLFGQAGDPTKVSKAKVFGYGTSLYSLLTAAKTPEEAGNLLVEQTGNSDDYERGYQMFSVLKPGIFDIPEEFRLTKSGGGARILPVKEGGLIRTNYAIGSDDKPVLPDDPTKPINPFAPKPIKPLEDNKMASGFGSYKDFIESTGDEELMDLYIEGLSSGDFTKLLDALKRKGYQSRDLAAGGRVGLALGSMPTAQESGLGGLPIEADMRYTGGFMPYGAKEKADDVPARLSKNEFVFTADAVRAAGGGSVNEGAKKMYQTMKKLEAKPEAKGMVA